MNAFSLIRLRLKKSYLPFGISIMPVRTLKYSKFLKETATNYQYISYNRLNPPSGSPHGAINYSFQDALRIIKPYIRSRWNEQMKVVMPIAAYLALFQIIVLRQQVNEWVQVALGIVSVIGGLMMFMEGLKLGLMPFGETIGYYLPIKLGKRTVLSIAFILGIGATLAEPAIGVLKEAGRIVPPEKSPLLFAMLTNYSHITVIAVAVGVGAAVMLGILMFIYGWSLKPLIFSLLVPTAALTIYASTDPMLADIIGLAWDCGAVTTGPVTVPLVLSLGIGTAGVIKHKHSKRLQGFGLVTLASLFPIATVLLAGIFIRHFLALDIAEPSHTENLISSLSSSTIFEGILLGIQAIIPLVAFLWIVQIAVIKEPIHNQGIIKYGILLALLGISLFNIGLSYGLSPLGNQVGALIPAAYSNIQSLENSPFFSESVGLWVCLLFAFFLGYGATLAEPALNALGITVENLTNGAFRKPLVMISVSFGVAFGLTIGVIKMIFNVPIVWFIIPTYLVASILTLLSDERYVNLGWDSSGVTTGPITVPLVIALGLGLSNASGAVDGFGILAMASVFPIISVLSVGLYVRRMERKKELEGQ